MKGDDDVNTAMKDEEADGSGEFLMFCIQIPDSCAFIISLTMNINDRQVSNRSVAKQKYIYF